MTAEHLDIRPDVLLPDHIASCDDQQVRPPQLVQEVINGRCEQGRIQSKVQSFILVKLGRDGPVIRCSRTRSTFNYRCRADGQMPHVLGPARVRQQEFATESERVAHQLETAPRNDPDDVLLLVVLNLESA